jgi:predicted transposase YdaD
MFELTKSEFQYGIQIYHKFEDLSHLVCREIRKSELQVQFINIASSETRQLVERLSYTDIFRAPPRAVRVALQRKTSVTIILNAPF